MKRDWLKVGPRVGLKYHDVAVSFAREFEPPTTGYLNLTRAEFETFLGDLKGSSSKWMSRINRSGSQRRMTEAIGYPFSLTWVDDNYHTALRVQRVTLAVARTEFMRQVHHTLNAEKRRFAWRWNAMKIDEWTDRSLRALAHQDLATLQRFIEDVSRSEERLKVDMQERERLQVEMGIEDIIGLVGPAMLELPPPSTDEELDDENGDE